MLNDQQLKVLLNFFNLSWPGYRKVRKGVKKRVGRHMRKLNCPDFKSYLSLLADNGNIRQECMQKLTIPISRFFRDRQLWDELRQKILPSIFKRKPEEITIWSVGCARGEEVYSFALLWDVLVQDVKVIPKLEIFAIDVNPLFIEQAKEGIFQASSLKELPPEHIETYFKKSTGIDTYRVSSRLQENIQWEVRSLFQAPPAKGYDIIFLRNTLLTYYDEPLRSNGFEMILDALKPGGWLLIGSHETIPGLYQEHFNLETASRYAFQKKSSN